MKFGKSAWMAALMAALVLLAGTAGAASAYRTAGGKCLDKEYYTDCEQEPTGGQMMWDALIMRPIGMAGTVLGTAVWLVSYPFSALGGNIDQATEKLVVAPFDWTFQRPLGEF